MQRAWTFAKVAMLVLGFVLYAALYSAPLVVVLIAILHKGASWWWLPVALVIEAVWPFVLMFVGGIIALPFGMVDEWLKARKKKAAQHAELMRYPAKPMLVNGDWLEPKHRRGETVFVREVPPDACPDECVAIVRTIWDEKGVAVEWRRSFGGVYLAKLNGEEEPRFVGDDDLSRRVSAVHVIEAAP